MRRFGYTTACFLGFFHLLPRLRYALMPKRRITLCTFFLFSLRWSATLRYPYEGNARGTFHLPPQPFVYRAVGDAMLLGRLPDTHSLVLHPIDNLLPHFWGDAVFCHTRLV